MNKGQRGRWPMAKKTMPAGPGKKKTAKKKKKAGAIIKRKAR